MIATTAEGRAMQERIMMPGGGLRAFPEPADVFVADQAADLARHLHPLVSVEPARVDPGWHGWVHLLSPLEPAQGYLGDHTRDFHSPLQTANWLGFALEDDRYRLLGDLRYFARATTPEELAKPWDGFHARLDAHCETQERSFRAHRAAFRRDGVLVRVEEDGSPEYGVSTPVPLLDQLGGVPEPSNWTDPELFPLDDTWPLSPAGNRFHFVAAVPGWHYRRRGADSILLFFEPEERLALLTFDWT